MDTVFCTRYDAILQMRERLAARRAKRAKQEELEREEARNLRPKSAADVFGQVMQMIPVSKNLLPLNKRSKIARKAL